MRFLMMHKNDAHTEAGGKPDMKLVEKMGEFIGAHAKAGRFLDGAGLSGSSKRTRVVARDGKLTTRRGPYRGENELPNTIYALEVKTYDEALGWAERYAKALGTGEVELGKVHEPWDIGIGVEPEGAPQHYLLIDKADAASEGSGRPPQVKAAVSRLATEMAKAGVLQRTIDLAPSSKAKRLSYTNNDLHVTTGPFTESVELIGGFSVMELTSMEEAIELSKPYAAILGGTLEIDVRPIERMEPDPKPHA
jgi:hypothetical protein